MTHSRLARLFHEAVIHSSSALLTARICSHCTALDLSLSRGFSLHTFRKYASAGDCAELVAPQRRHSLICSSGLLARSLPGQEEGFGSKPCGAPGGSQAAAEIWRGCVASSCTPAPASSRDCLHHSCEAAPVPAVAAPAAVPAG